MVDDITGSATVLAADTICVDHEGGLLGKPADRADAQTILRRLIAHPHRVITGVALLPIRDGQAGEMQCFADTAVVTFGKVSDEQLARYLATDGWRGKAGGYNLFDRQAEGWAVQVAGDPATVVGLPMWRLIPLLGGPL